MLCFSVYHVANFIKLFSKCIHKNAEWPSPVPRYQSWGSYQGASWTFKNRIILCRKTVLSTIFLCHFSPENSQSGKRLDEPSKKLSRPIEAVQLCYIIGVGHLCAFSAPVGSMLNLFLASRPKKCFLQY